MDHKLYDAFETCLQALEQGESTEDCLGRFPELMDELRPMLYAAQRAHSLRTVEVPKQAAPRAHARLLRHAAEMREAAARPRRTRFTFRKLAYVLALVLFFMFSGTGLVNASSTAIPGDNLYSFKRTWEDFRLLFTFNPDARVALEEAFEDERYEEVYELFEHGRAANIAIVGILNDQMPDVWTVSGLQVALNISTYVDANITVGDMVIVHGLTQPESLQVLATHIELAPVGTRLPAFEEDDDDGIEKQQLIPSPTIDPASTKLPILDAEKDNDSRLDDNNSGKGSSSGDSSDGESDDEPDDDEELDD